MPFVGTASSCVIRPSGSRRFPTGFVVARNVARAWETSTAYERRRPRMHGVRGGGGWPLPSKACRRLASAMQRSGWAGPHQPAAATARTAGPGTEPWADLRGSAREDQGDDSFHCASNDGQAEVDEQVENGNSRASALAGVLRHRVLPGPVPGRRSPWWCRYGAASREFPASFQRPENCRDTPTNLSRTSALALPGAPKSGRTEKAESWEGMSIS